MYKIIFSQFGDGIKIIKFSCYYHVILPDIATVHCDILCNRMIPHMFNVHSQPSCNVIVVYINAHMIIIMINAIFWDYYPLSIDIIHYTYDYYFSPHRVM